MRIKDINKKYSFKKLIVYKTKNKKTKRLCNFEKKNLCFYMK